MKRLATILILLATVLGIAIGGVCYVKVVTDRVSQELTEISREIGVSYEISTQGETISAEALSEEVDALCQDWEKAERILGTYLKHEGIGEIAKNLKKLRSYCQVAYFKEAIPLIEELKYSLHHLYEEELPLPKNIL